MQIRLAHTTDAAAVNELLHQLGYAQDGTATTATRIQTWGDDPSSAAYVAEADGDLLDLVAVHICPFFERTGSSGADRGSGRLRSRTRPGRRRSACNSGGIVRDKSWMRTHGGHQRRPPPRRTRVLPTLQLRRPNRKVIPVPTRSQRHQP